MSRDSGSKVKKSINFADIVQSKGAFTEPRFLGRDFCKASFHLLLLLFFKQLFIEHAINARDDLALFVLAIFHLGEDKKSLVPCENAQFLENLNRSAIQKGGAPCFWSCILWARLQVGSNQRQISKSVHSVAA